MQVPEAVTPLQPTKAVVAAAAAVLAARGGLVVGYGGRAHPKLHCPNPARRNTIPGSFINYVTQIDPHSLCFASMYYVLI